MGITKYRTIRAEMNYLGKITIRDKKKAITRIPDALEGRAESGQEGIVRKGALRFICALRSRSI